MKSSKAIVEAYLKQSDWRTKENSNSPSSFGKAKANVYPYYYEITFQRER